MTNQKDPIYFDNYSPEEFELIYTINKQNNFKKGINIDIKIAKTNGDNNRISNKNNVPNELDLVEKEYLKFFAI